MTRAIARRPYVNVMIPEADGVIRSNSYPRKFPVSVGHAPSTPWTVDLTDAEGRFWLLAFDLDAKQPEELEQAAEDLGVLVRVLRACAIPHVVCRSSPTGGFHVFVAVDGVTKPVTVQLAAAAKAVLRQLDHGLLCNDRTGAVRPPGAPHARGGASMVMEGDPGILAHPTVTASDLERLIAALQELRPSLDPTTQPPSGPADPLHRAHRALPAWGEAHMATVAGGADPSRTGYLCLLAAATAGWSLHDVERAALTAPGMEHYRTRRSPTGRREPRKPQEAAARLARQWERAQDRVAQNRYAPQEHPAADISELSELVDVAEGMLTAFRVSPGRWAATETAFHNATVLTALAWLSLRSGTRDTAAALRDIAGLTGIPSSTVHRVLRRLRTDGWVTRTRVSEGPNSAVWRVSSRFSTDRQQDGPLHLTNARPRGEVFDTRIVILRELEDRLEAGRHDVFTRGGLGPTARRVYECLTSMCRSSADIADRAGMPLGRVNAALSRLRRHRLATTEGGWRRRARDYRAWAASRLGVRGVLDRRSRRYEHERELWAWWQNHLERKAGRPGRPRAAAQTLLFHVRDRNGGSNAWPNYPTDADGRGDHRAAWRHIEAGLVQHIRDTELSAA